MKLKKIFNKYIAIVPALVTITLIAAKCEYDPGVKVFYDLNQLRLEAVEKESLELIDNYEKNITKFWSDRQALNELKKLAAKVREIENKAEQELKEYSEPAKAKVEHEDSDEKDSSVLTAKKALAKFDRSATEIKIPSEFTKIGKNAFNNFYNLGKIEFHDNVTEIRQGAFDNTDLDSVTLPKNLKVLGGFANTYIKTLEIPQSVTKILQGSFDNTNIGTIKLPEKLTELGGFKATGISELKLPESLTKIYENSFDETPITKLKLNKNLKILGGFNTLRNLEEFELMTS